MKKRYKYIASVKLSPSAARGLVYIQATEWLKYLRNTKKHLKKFDPTCSKLWASEKLDLLWAPHHSSYGVSCLSKTWESPIIDLETRWSSIYFDYFASPIKSTLDYDCSNEVFQKRMDLFVDELYSAVKKSYKAVSAFLCSIKKYVLSIDKRTAFRKMIQLVFKNLDDEAHFGYSFFQMNNQCLTIKINTKTNVRNRIYLSNQYITQFRD